jgi:threonine aldolase
MLGWNFQAILVLGSLHLMHSLVSPIPYFSDSTNSFASVKVLNLQNQHPELKPAETLGRLQDACSNLNISQWDVYGDFHLDSQSSYLRRFEAEVAAELGKQDAVFLPSGVMAQSIALLIHSSRRKQHEEIECIHKRMFLCHHSSHLLLHESDAYYHLLNMKPIVINTKKRISQNGYSIPAMSWKDLEENPQLHQNYGSISTLIVEIPHRELGGKCSSMEDLIHMKKWCTEHGIRFHCDGARLWEAAATYYDQTISSSQSSDTCYPSNKSYSLQQLVSIFDSVYVSFYKGLGGIAGAMLLGDNEFCEEVRVWLRRFGGNIYTLLPYAVSAWSGYRSQWVNQDGNALTFPERYLKLSRLVTKISAMNLVSFDPEIPQVNMVHGYFRYDADAVLAAVDRVFQNMGKRIRVLTRVRNIPDTEPAYLAGYRSTFEWTMGSENGNIPDDVFLSAWQALSNELD